MTSLAQVEGLKFRLVDLIGRLRPGARRTDCSSVALGNLRIAKRGMLTGSHMLRKSTGVSRTEQRSVLFNHVEAAQMVREAVDRTAWEQRLKKASQTFSTASPDTLIGPLAEVRKALARPYPGDAGLIKLLTIRGNLPIPTLSPEKDRDRESVSFALFIWFSPLECVYEPRYHILVVSRNWHIFQAPSKLFKPASRRAATKFDRNATVRWRSRSSKSSDGG